VVKEPAAHINAKFCIFLLKNSEYYIWADYLESNVKKKETYQRNVVNSTDDALSFICRSNTNIKNSPLKKGSVTYCMFYVKYNSFKLQTCCLVTDPLWIPSHAHGVVALLGSIGWFKAADVARVQVFTYSSFSFDNKETGRAGGRGGGGGGPRRQLQSHGPGYRLRNITRDESESVRITRCSSDGTHVMMRWDSFIRPAEGTFYKSQQRCTK